MLTAQAFIALALHYIFIQTYSKQALKRATDSVARFRACFRVQRQLAVPQRHAHQHNGSVQPRQRKIRPQTARKCHFHLTTRPLLLRNHAQLGCQKTCVCNAKWALWAFLREPYTHPEGPTSRRRHPRTRIRFVILFYYASYICNVPAHDLQQKTHVIAHDLQQKKYILPMICNKKYITLPMIYNKGTCSDAKY